MRRRRPALGWKSAPGGVLGLVVCSLVLVAGSSERPRAEAMVASDEALRLAFPDAQVEPHTVFLSEAQVALVAERTGRPLATKLFTYHVARRAGAIVGYGVIETHVVRTLPEAFLVVLDPEGSITRVIMLAFYEPPEYRPPDRWLKQFDGRRTGDARGWRVGREIHGISGATLTAYAVTDALRRILLLFDLVVRPGAS